MLGPLLFELRRLRVEITHFIHPLVFMIMITVLFPLAFGVSLSDYSVIAPGLVWCVVLWISVMMSEHIIGPDKEEGVLAARSLSLQPLGYYIVSKCIAHTLGVLACCLSCLPLSALLLGLSLKVTLVLASTLVLGVPALSFIAGFAATLVQHLKRSGILAGVILIPLYAPVLIFSMSALDNARLELSLIAPLALLGAYSLFHIALMPIVSVHALRLGENE